MDADTIVAFIGQNCIGENVRSEEEEISCLTCTHFELLYRERDGRGRIVTLVKTMTDTVERCSLQFQFRNGINTCCANSR